MNSVWSSVVQAQDLGTEHPRVQVTPPLRSISGRSARADAHKAADAGPAEEVGIWADALEMYDDVEYEADAEKQVPAALFQLANEFVGSRPVTPQEARRLIVELKS